jgi:hypothetical protein
MHSGSSCYLVFLVVRAVLPTWFLRIVLGFSFSALVLPRLAWPTALQQKSEGVQK